MGHAAIIMIRDEDLEKIRANTAGFSMDLIRVLQGFQSGEREGKILMGAAEVIGKISLDQTLTLCLEGNTLRVVRKT